MRWRFKNSSGGGLCCACWTPASYPAAVPSLASLRSPSCSVTKHHESPQAARSQTVDAFSGLPARGCGRGVAARVAGCQQLQRRRTPPACSPASQASWPASTCEAEEHRRPAIRVPLCRMTGAGELSNAGDLSIGAAAAERADSTTLPGGGDINHGQQAASIRKAAHVEEPSQPVTVQPATPARQTASAATPYANSQPPSTPAPPSPAQTQAAAQPAQSFDAVRPSLLHRQHSSTAPHAAAQPTPPQPPATPPPAAKTDATQPRQSFDPVRPALLRRHRARAASVAASSSPLATLIAEGAGPAPLPPLAGSQPAQLPVPGAAATAEAAAAGAGTSLREDKFTLMALTHPQRMPSLKVYVAHYRNCSQGEAGPHQQPGHSAVLCATQLLTRPANDTTSS